MERSTDSAWMLVFACWAVATASTLGALFFSEVMELPPCSLCWYQRIFMFPLVLILPAGLFPYDGKAVRFCLPLTLVGWGVSLFQVLLVRGHALGQQPLAARQHFGQRTHFRAALVEQLDLALQKRCKTRQRHI